MPEPLAADTVGNDETLYRRVPRNTDTQQYYTREGKRLHVLRAAFGERPVPEGEPYAGQYRLSVDRAKLCGFNPVLTQQAAISGVPADYGVVCMPTIDVRAINNVEAVIPDPILHHPQYPDNPAHALICIRPSPQNTKNANKIIMKEVAAELADLANRTPWAIEPQE